MHEKVATRYPTLCQVLHGTSFAADVEEAVISCGGQDPQRALHKVTLAAIGTKGGAAIKSKRLSYYACCPCFTKYAEDVVDGVEADLKTLIGRLPIGQLVAAYKDKLLNDDQFEDVVCEITAAATLASILDEGTLSLETTLAGKKSNTDVTGCLGGQKIRVEVTVVHDNWPPTLDATCREIVEAADVPVGYTVVLGSTTVTEATAREARDLIEELHGQSVASPAKDLRHAKFTFLLCGDDYVCSEKGTLISRLTFEDDPAVRLAAIPAASRSTMDKHERDQLQNPPGVVVFGGDSENHNDNPLSTRIWQRVDEKVRRQCEDGILNLVVLGQSKPWNDNSVHDALFGAPFASVGYIEDESGLRHPISSSLQHTLSGPFRPYADLPVDLSAEERELLLRLRSSFARLSAVLMVRIGGSYATAKLHVNANAATPLAPGDATKIEKDFQTRCERTKSAI